MAMLKSNEHSFLRPVKADEFLPPVSRWTSLGGLILIGSVGVAITLASIVQYNVTVKATAIVRPDGDLRIVQAATEGTIERINVSVNQKVRQGDILAQIDPSGLENQKIQLEETIQQNQLQINQIDAQIRFLNAQIVAETRSRDQAVAAAEAELRRDQSQSTEQRATTQANLAEAEAALEFARREMQRYQQLANTGAVAQLQVEEKQAAAKTAEAQVARAQAALNPGNATVAITQERIEQERASGAAAVANLNRELESLMQSRAELQNQLLQAQRTLQQTEIDRQKTIIRATSDGTILRLNLRNANQVVNSGETIAEISPDDHNLMIKTRVSTQDIDKVKLGQSAQLRVTACPYPDYGTLSGKVIAVSPDAITAQSTTQSVTQSSTTDSAYFEVTIQPAASTLVQGNRQCLLQAGMEAEANIISRKETAMQFLLRRARLLTDQ